MTLIKKEISAGVVYLLEETEVLPEEGIYHSGRGSVIRFVGKKPSR